MEQPDLVQQGIRTAERKEAVENLKHLVRSARWGLVSIHILLLIILWRVW
jgi:hypothetical protein